jgi:hypothetical protein
MLRDAGIRIRCVARAKFADGLVAKITASAHAPRDGVGRNGSSRTNILADEPQRSCDVGRLDFEDNGVRGRRRGARAQLSLARNIAL